MNTIIYHLFLLSAPTVGMAYHPLNQKIDPAMSYGPVEDILPASSRGTRRFHLGKLQKWDATGGVPKTCHVGLIHPERDPQSASLSLLKPVGPLPDMCWDIEAGGWWLGGLCSSMWFESPTNKFHRWGTMVSSVSLIGNNHSNLVREDLSCRDKQQQSLGHPTQEALGRDSDSAVRLGDVRNAKNHWVFSRHQNDAWSDTVDCVYLSSVYLHLFA